MADDWMLTSQPNPLLLVENRTVNPSNTVCSGPFPAAQGAAH